MMFGRLKPVILPFAPSHGRFCRFACRLAVVTMEEGGQIHSVLFVPRKWGGSIGKGNGALTLSQQEVLELSNRGLSIVVRMLLV